MDNPEFTKIDIDSERTTATAKPITDTVRLCIKCCRKLDAEGKALRKAVKTAIRDAYGETVQLEKVDCFSLCPKGGQVLSTSAAQHARRLVIIQPDSNVQKAIEYLLQPS